MEHKKIVVVGGSAAGAKAAAKARRLDEFAEITLIQKTAEGGLQQAVRVTHASHALYCQRCAMRSNIHTSASTAHTA